MHNTRLHRQAEFGLTFVVSVGAGPLRPGPSRGLRDVVDVVKLAVLRHAPSPPCGVELALDECSSHEVRAVRSVFVFHPNTYICTPT